MIIEIPIRYQSELNNDDINRILTYLNLTNEYEIRHVSRNGRAIIIESDIKKHYVIFSRRSAGGDESNSSGRNSFLAQYIPTVLNLYVNDEATQEKNISVYLLDTGRFAKVSYIIDTYRMAKTLGFSILNEQDLNLGEIRPYSSVREWKNAKDDRRTYNPANKSSYVIEDIGDDGVGEYNIFGKLYGANGKESAYIACVISKIAQGENKRVNFFQVKEHGTDRASVSDKNVIEYFGCSITDEIYDYNAEDLPIITRNTSRDQAKFKLNLLHKYGQKKCYLCGCDIEQSIIASHIHRITDIDRSELSQNEKYLQATDADNGFWLCANHDKFFEYNILTFNLNGLLTINSSLETHQIDFIRSITNRGSIEQIHFTQKLLQYLRFHNLRVSLGLD